MKELTQEFLDEVTAQVGQGLHCSQVVFAYGAKKLGFDEAAAKKISAAFGGGMFDGERCGSATGALMALGLKYGHSGAEDKANEAELTEKRLEFNKRFVEKFGSLQCADILGANIGTPEGYKRVVEEKLTRNCPALIAYSCLLLEDLL